MNEQHETALTGVERERLQELEVVVAAGLQTFLEVGKALLEIRTSRLYRGPYATFEDYCRQRWEMNRQRASQLICSVEVVNNLSTVVDKPESERQVRPLVGLEPQEQREAWEEACQTAPEGKVTGTYVAEVVQRRKLERLQSEAAAAPEPPAGLWQIIHGDSLVELPKLVAGSARLIFADPPYNEGIDYGGGSKADSLVPHYYLEWCRRWMKAGIDVLAPDGSFWLLISNRYAAGFEQHLIDLGLYPRAWITWYETFGANCTGNFNRTSRRLLYFVKDPKSFVFHPEAVNRPSDRQTKYDDPRANPSGKVWDDVWGINPPIPRLTGTCAERLPEFPTQLPLALLRPVIGCASDPGDLVLDPFSGSGTTGAACLELGRRFLGIEQNARFAELATLRLKGARV